ncbi:IclR family transcriptional regulator [Streptomyces sp. LX-29]|uniref:IclR family transcriptional regulator n=1 Tax=Streptomyces sp. LX-29 TaxID=2900152 RepID=UPI00240E481D|nr:IclR family transcriptional regulator [Streptomyces sp. LX-29]WFB09345.1 IclR family transcriptional regulator [Streptomyces sp. LX-29]
MTQSVQSVQRAVRILRELASAGPRLGVTDLAARVDAAKPTVHALLRTLEAEGLVERDAETSKYQLGPELVFLGNAYLETQTLRTRSVVWAEALAAQTGEAVWVGVLTGERVLVVHHALRPTGALQLPEAGSSLPWPACALGKAIAAFAPCPERERLLAAARTRPAGAGPTDPAELATQLDVARATGYAVEDQESALGEAGIAAPVFDRSGAAAGAIGLVGPRERLLAEESRQRLAVAVRDTARALSRDLGAPRGCGARLAG